MQAQPRGGKLQRLKSHRDFVTVLKTRTKVSSKDLVVHFHIQPNLQHLQPSQPELMKHGGVQAPNQTVATHDAARSSVHDAMHAERRLGLAVSKAVGNAVVRNHVKRRLRVLARDYESLLPEACDVVIRAKPTADQVSFEQLQRQIEHTFATIARKAVAKQAEQLQ